MRFGNGIIAVGGAIDRRKLAKAAFKNKNSRLALEKITHPEIIREIKKAIKTELKKKKTVCLEAPLLFEAGISNLTDAVLVVYASKKTELNRLKKKGYSESEAESRIKAQLPIEEKLKEADFVIVNESGLSGLKKQVSAINDILRTA